jgi:hypothetical protein
MIALLAATPLQAQDLTYYREGRTVGMGEGGPKVFFTYYNVRHERFREAGMAMAEGLLESIRSDADLGGKLNLSDENKEIVSKIELRPSSARNLGMIASYQDGRYLIWLPDESSYFQWMMAQAMAELSAHEDLGYFNLLIMSEMDWFRGRSPRWYSATTYAAFQGYPPPPTDPGNIGTSMGLAALVMLPMLFHEICHHTLRHTTDGARQINALRQQGRSDELSALSIRNELTADRCAAELTIRAGGLPSYSMTAALALSIVMGDAPSATHPMSNERIVLARQYDREAIASAVDRGLFPANLAEPASRLSEVLFDQLADYHERYN